MQEDRNKAMSVVQENGSAFIIKVVLGECDNASGRRNDRRACRGRNIIAKMWALFGWAALGYLFADIAKRRGDRAFSRSDKAIKAATPGIETLPAILFFNP